MTKNPRKLWSYWKHQIDDRLTVWQIVEVLHDGGTEDIYIQLVFTKHEPGDHQMKVGACRSYTSDTLRDKKYWQPILKEDIPLMYLRGLED